MSIRINNSKKIRFLFFVSFLAPTLNATVAFTSTYSGQADHRLVVIDQSLKREPFDPNQDLLIPSAAEKRWATLRKAVMKSTFETLIPFASYIKGNQSGVKKNIFQSILSATSLADKSLAKIAMKSFRENSQWLPFNHDFYLIPATLSERNLFYGDEKVSMNGIDVVNMLGAASESTPKFAAKVTENIKKLQTKYQDSKQPFSLLAFRRSIVISEKVQRLSLYLLIQIAPRELEFKKPSDKVNLQKIVIPATYKIRTFIPGRYREENCNNEAALITVDLDFNLKDAKPSMTVEFGTFDRYDFTTVDGTNIGEFFLVDEMSDRCMPRMEGEVSKLGEWGPISFGFKKLEIDLATQKVENLDIYTRPGLNLWGLKIAPIAFNSQDIDKEFTGEFDKSIQEAKQDLINKMFGSDDEGSK